jgi:hypothetical protein
MRCKEKTMARHICTVLTVLLLVPLAAMHTAD